MARIAEIQGGRVINIIVAPSADWPASVGLPGVWVDITSANPAPNIGWAYNASSRTFAAPDA